MHHVSRSTRRAREKLLSRRLDLSPARLKPVKASAGVVEFECNPWQFDFLNRSEPFLLGAVGGIGSGKTWSLARWAVMECRFEAGTGTLGLIAANSYKQLNQAVLPHVWQFLSDLGLKYGDDYVYNEQPPRFWRGFQSRFLKDHKNVLSIKLWGQILGRSLENYDDTRSMEFGYIGQDEARDAAKEAFNVLLGRLRCPRARRHRYRLVTSPNGYDYVYKELVERRDEFGETRQLIQMKTTDNVLGLSPEYAKRLYQSYDSKLAQQELEGKFLNVAAGLVYHSFDRTVHVRALAPRDADWQVSFDFNRTPYSVALCQTTGSRDKPEEQEVHVVDEIFADDMDTSRACEEVFKRLDGFDTRGRIEVYGDATGGSMTTKSNQSDYDIITQRFRGRYGQRFVRCWRESNPPVMARVNAVNAMLENSLGERRLFLSEKCKNLRADFEQVIFSPGSNQIHKGKDPRLTHISDALGYYIAERFPVRRSTAGLVFI